MTARKLFYHSQRAIPLLLVLLLLPGIAVAQTLAKDNLNAYDAGKLFFKVKDDSMQGLTTSGMYMRMEDMLTAVRSGNYGITSVKQVFRLPDEKLKRIFLVEFEDTVQTE